MTDHKPMFEAEFSQILDMAMRARMDDDVSFAAGTADGRRTTEPQIHTILEQLLNSPAYVPVDKLARLYDEDRAGTPAERARDLDEFIARELTLSPDLTVEDLKRLRREFAIANHPDRVSPADRDRATRRMSLVNVLIDKALRARRAEAT